MAPWEKCPSFHFDLDAPPKRWFQAMDDRLIARVRDLLSQIQQEVPPAVANLAHLFNARTGWRFSGELKAAARRIGIDWRWLMIGNVFYDLAMAKMGCSAVALATPEGPVVARNMDWWPADKLAGASCLVRFVRGGRLRFAIAGWPGAAGIVTGLSSRGFALVLNAVQSPEGHRRAGYPVLLFLRKVLQHAGGFDQAVRLISRQKLFTSALVTVVGVANEQRVVIERTPTRSALRWPGDSEPLVATNQYRSLAAGGGREMDEQTRQWFDVACGRYEGLGRLARQIMADGRFTSESLLDALTDASVMQTITAQHVIMQPARQRIEMFVPRRLLAPG